MPESSSSGEGLAARTVKGSAYSIGASAVTMVLGFGRSVLMARLLAPEDFGIVAFALTFLNFTRPLRDFGLDQALVHRKLNADSPLDDALAVHFSLRLVLMGLFMLLFMAAIPALRRFYPGRPMLVPVLLGLTAGEMATAVGSTPITYLRKEMRFKEVAILQVLTSISMTAVGPLMAWRGWGVWAIVGERVSGTVVATLVVWAFIRPWRLRLALDSRMARWYLSYGKFVSATQALDKVLSDFDDFWVGTVLGAQPLGYYSKAYELAGYPRRVVSDPVVQVLFPAFAEAQHDQLRLSRAYFRASCLVVRVGFLLAGCLVLSASALVPLMLGGRWTPMTSAFQLMVVYALLIPLMSVTGNLVNAVGHPELTTRTRAAQSIILVPAVIIGARWWSINGVALATDVVLLLGLLLLLRQSRRIVEVSFKSMLLLPTLALLAGILLGLASTAWLDATTVMALLFRLGGFLIVYNGLLVVFEGKQYRSQLRVAYEAFSGGPLDLSSERIGLCLRRWLRVHD